MGNEAAGFLTRSEIGALGVYKVVHAYSVLPYVTANLWQKVNIADVCLTPYQGYCIELGKPQTQKNT